jgi:hypothetical protein
MSSFLGQTGTLQLGVGPNVPTDDRGRQGLDQWAFSPGLLEEPWQEGVLWTVSSGLGGQFSNFGMMGDDQVYAGAYYEYPLGLGWNMFGGQVENCIVGQTLDQNGNPLANCIVQGFVTTTDAYVGSVTSDNSGWYKLPTPYSTATHHYIVAYKSGSPDVAGTSVNTLVPTATG